jgi:tetratricopeptide (TPR) repeat protein
LSRNRPGVVFERLFWVFNACASRSSFSGLWCRQPIPAGRALDHPKERIFESEDYSRALGLAASGRIPEANARLVRLCSRFPEILEIRISLGVNQQKLGQHRQGVENFRQVLKRDPLNMLAHFNLAVSYFELKELDNSMKELEAALAITPYYSRAEELMGAVWLQKKDYTKARTYFQKLLTQEPNNYAAHYNLGALATMQGKWEEANVTS